MITPQEQRADGWRSLAEEPDLPRWGESAPDGAKVLATIVHLSDVHLCDAESPARLEYLDHLSDPGEPYADIFTEIGTYRPQEILTAQVASAMVESVNGVTTGPVGVAARLNRAAAARRVRGWDRRQRDSGPIASGIPRGRTRGMARTGYRGTWAIPSSRV